MKAYITSIVVLLIVLLFHTGGQNWYYDFYRHYVDFDMIPHFLAGFGAGMFMIEFFQNRLKFSEKSKEFFTVGCMFAVTIAWEIFEIITNTAGYILFTEKYYVDTIKDISMGLAGCMLAILIFRRYFSKK